MKVVIKALIAPSPFFKLRPRANPLYLQHEPAFFLAINYRAKWLVLRAWTINSHKDLTGSFNKFPMVSSKERSKSYALKQKAKSLTDLQ